MPLRRIRPILERLAYGCYFLLLIASIGITWLGWLTGMSTGDFKAMWVAMGGLAIARWLHVHGHAHWHFRECQASLDRLGSLRSGVEEDTAAEISVLFERLEGETDVWARSEIRKQIATKLTVAPALREDFAEALSRHPEL